MAPRGPGLVVLRRAVADMGARADLLVDEIDDLAEVAAAACRRGSSDVVTLALRATHGEVELVIDGSIDHPPTLGALAERYEREVVDGVERHHLLFRSRSAPA